MTFARCPSASQTKASVRSIWPGRRRGLRRPARCSLSAVNGLGCRPCVDAPRRRAPHDALSGSHPEGRWGLYRKQGRAGRGHLCTWAPHRAGPGLAPHSCARALGGRPRASASRMQGGKQSERLTARHRPPPGPQPCLQKGCKLHNPPTHPARVPRSPLPSRLMPSRDRPCRSPSPRLSGSCRRHSSCRL